MLRFAHIEFLWGLVGLPVFILVFIGVRTWKKKALARLGDMGVIKNIIPDVSFSRPTLKFIFFIIAYGLLIIGLSDPQIGTATEDVQKKGADLMIVLDVSNSMLCQDIAPSRLENAKRALDQLIDNLHNERIGIVVFAGEPYVQLPMTTDYSAAKLFLSEISTDMVPVQGTAIGSAIDMAVKSFDFKNNTSKAIILMTDGENHEDDAVRAAEDAAEKKVMINVIGFGSGQGAPVPIYKDGKPAGFHLDTAGHTVISKLDENMCKELASAGNGVFVKATNAGTGLTEVMGQINKMQQNGYDSKQFKDFEDRFQFFLVIGFLLLIIEFFISNRKSLRLSNLKLFEVKKT